MFLKPFYCTQMGNWTRMCSQAFRDQTPSPLLHCLVLQYTKLLSVPSTQSLYRLDRLVMSYLLISVWLAHLAQSFTAEMWHLKITRSCSAWWTAKTLSQHCNQCEVSISLSSLVSFSKTSVNLKHVNKEKHDNKLSLSLKIGRKHSFRFFWVHEKHMPKVLMF